MLLPLVVLSVALQCKDIDFLLIDGSVRWDWGLYLRLGEVMRAASLAEKVPVRWGGTWKLLSAINGPITAKILSRSFPDGPHFELQAASYP